MKECFSEHKTRKNTTEVPISSGNGEYMYLLEEEAVNDIIESLYHVIFRYQSILNSRKMLTPRPFWEGKRDEP